MIAVVLTLCTSATLCNSYFVDSGKDQTDCMINLVNHSEQMANVWRDDRSLKAFLKKSNIVENVKLLNDYDYTCEFVPDNLIP